MSKKRRIIENVLIGVLLLGVYAGSAIALFHYSNRSTESRLTSTVQVAEGIFDGSSDASAQTTGEALVSDYSYDKEVRISILQRQGEGYQILYDSWGNKDASVSAPELDAPGHLLTRTSHYGYPMVYLVALDEENPSYYVRAAIKTSVASRLSRNFMIYGTLSLVLILGLYAFYRVYEYRASVKPLSEQIERLYQIAGERPSQVEEEDDVLALADAVSDVSDRLSQQISDLKREQEKVHAILDSMSQGFLAIQKDGTLTLINKAGLSIFGYESAKEVLGKDFHLLSQDLSFGARISEFLEKGEEGSFDFLHNDKIYEIQCMELSEAWQSGTGKGLALLIEDVTEERNLARVKSDFFQNASHELKSPLTSTLGYLQMIDSGILEDPGEKKAALEKAIQEAVRMKEILSDMTALNRLDEGKKEPLEQIEVKGEIMKIADLLSPQASKKGVTFSFHGDGFVLSMGKEDFTRLFQNLLDNAVKYNKQNGKVDVSFSPRRVKISDTGIGIKKENLPRIYERFYRVDNSRGGENIEGSGLGLAIVKHIVLKYGASIHVESAFGIATTFTLDFPAEGK